MASAPIAACGFWADMSVAVNGFGFDAPPAKVKSAKTPATKATKATKASPPAQTANAATNLFMDKDMSHSVVAAKVHAEIGDDIRWDVILEEVAQLAPAALLHEKRVLSLPLKKDTAEAAESTEGSTSAGDTTDSELSLSDADFSPKSAKAAAAVAGAFRPPPGLAPPPGLEAPIGMPPPPGLEDWACLPSSLTPPPGFFQTPGNITVNQATTLTATATAKPRKLPKAQKAQKSQKVQDAQKSEKAVLPPWRQGNQGIKVASP